MLTLSYTLPQHQEGSYSVLEQYSWKAYTPFYGGALTEAQRGGRKRLSLEECEATDAHSYSNKITVQLQSTQS